MFMAASMAIIEISDIPIAVRKASLNGNWRIKMKVSKAMEVSNPLMMARIMMAMVDQPESVQTN